jgi:pilus assembly protein CpaB
MDTTSKLLFGAGAVLAIIVGVGVYLAVSAAQGLGRTLTTVVVAQRDIPERTLFTGANIGELLTTRQVPADLVPQGALTRPADATGNVTTTRLVPGEIVLGTPERLASGEGATARPAAAIPRDKVALAIPSGEAVSVAGALQPGDRVDVIATWVRPGGTAVTQDIFQDVRVFAVGQWQAESRVATAAVAAVTGSSVAPSVTLLLDYQQAVVLEYLLRTGGQVAVALRRFDQSGDVTTEPMTAEALSRRYFNADGDGVAR